MSTVSKHILNEIADKLDNKKDDFQMQIEKLDALSQETLEILNEIVVLYEKMELEKELSEEEREKLLSLIDQLEESDDYKDIIKN
jgi:transcriptional/translational regulatory protein YebC/TACO1